MTGLSVVSPGPKGVINGGGRLRSKNPPCSLGWRSEEDGLVEDCQRNGGAGRPHDIHEQEPIDGAIGKHSARDSNGNVLPRLERIRGSRGKGHSRRERCHVVGNIGVPARPRYDA